MPATVRVLNAHTFGNSPVVFNVVPVEKYEPCNFAKVNSKFFTNYLNLVFGTLQWIPCFDCQTFVGKKHPPTRSRCILFPQRSGTNRQSDLDRMSEVRGIGLVKTNNKILANFVGAVFLCGLLGTFKLPKRSIIRTKFTGNNQVKLSSSNLRRGIFTRIFGRKYSDYFSARKSMCSAEKLLRITNITLGRFSLV